MIEHLKTGYVAELQQSADLARGISYVLDEADYQVISKACVSKVAHSYSQQSVARRYMEVYEH